MLTIRSGGVRAPCLGFVTINLVLEYKYIDSRVIFLFLFLFIVFNNYNYKNYGRRYQLSQNRGTQRICSSQYLFYKQNFAAGN